MSPKISLSIADIPLGISWNSLFSLAKYLGLDGIEVVSGLKTIFSTENIFDLCKRYELPVLTLHEPGWSTFGFLNYEASFKMAQKLGALYNAHPFIFNPIDSSKTIKYHDWLRKMSKKYSVKVLIENMPQKTDVKIIDLFFKVNDSTKDLLIIKNVANTYGFEITLDTSHLFDENPQENSGVKEILPLIKNIHISSFKKGVQHLSLNKGVLNIKPFLEFLKAKRYNGIITLELTPKIFYSKERYFEDIKKSVEIIKEYGF